MEKTSFAPMLRIRNGVTDIDFYKNAFGAIEHFRVNNDDGTVHVAEFDIDGAIFHIHEIYPHTPNFDPSAHTGVVTIGLFTDAVHTVFDRAIAAGARSVMPVTDFDYGYRQGEFVDPFGHKWIIEKEI